MRREGLPAAAPPAWTEAPPDPPELPEAVDPRWPAWSAPVALIASLFAMGFAIAPFLVPLGLLESDSSLQSTLEGPSLLLLIAVQDAVLVGTAWLFARITVRPRTWHFGLRPTRFWPTVGLIVLAVVVLLGFEIGYIELLGVDDSNVEDLAAEDSLLGAIAVSIAVIVVAPVTEEFFFRGFFYRALRNRMRIGWAVLIDALVFTSLHFEGASTLATLPVVAVFGAGVCLVYERTGSLFAVIAIHAIFNTFATAVSGGQVMIVALVTGAIVLLGCVLVPRRLPRAPSPLRGAARKGGRLAAGPPPLAPSAPPPAISPAGV